MLTIAPSYEYAVGSVKAKERALLTAADLEMLLAAPDVETLAGTLRDKGYEGADVDEMLRAREKETWAYVGRLVDDWALFAPLLYQNDLHNAKVILKSTLTGRSSDGLLTEPVTIPAQELREAVTGRRFDRLPEWIGPALAQAYEIVAHNTDARLGDAVLDRAAMAAMLAGSARLSESVREYFRTLVFYSDVKIALRAARTGAEAAYLEAALCPVEGLELRRLTEMALAGSHELIEWLKGQEAYGCRQAAEAFERSPSAFEKAVDDRLIALMRRSRFGVEGIDVLYGYLLAVQAEIKVIHIIASGVRTGAGESAIRERVRELHG